jgi:WXG100 family type VII secretion target
MSNAFSVDPDALTDAVARMAGFERYVESMVDEIEGLVANLHMNWGVAAADAHAGAHRQWAEGAATMRKALGELQTAATIAHHNYTGAAATNQRMWS